VLSSGTGLTTELLTTASSLDPSERTSDAAIYALEGAYNHKFVFHPDNHARRTAFLKTHSLWFDRIEFTACLALLLTGLLLTGN